MPTDSNPIADYSYSYTADGQKSQEQRTTDYPTLSSVTSNYSYDVLGRLETDADNTGATHRYCFDADSNRTKIISPSSGSCASGTATATYSYGSGPIDALNLAGTTEYAYTGDGQQNCRGNIIRGACTGDSYRWDGLGRIKSATVGGKSTCYTYSPDGSLKQRVFDNTGSTTCATANTTTKYLLGDSYEADATNAITTSYVNGPAGDLATFPSAPSPGATPTYLYYTGHGDLAAEANSSGTTIATHTYDPWGTPLAGTQPTDKTSHRYTGRWDKQYDSTTSLVLMGARPYDPSLGRFIAVDPIDGGSLNNYDYAGQDPIDGYDLDGLQSLGDGPRNVPVRGRIGAAGRVAVNFTTRHLGHVVDAHGPEWFGRERGSGLSPQERNTYVAVLDRAAQSNYTFRAVNESQGGNIVGHYARVENRPFVMYTAGEGNTRFEVGEPITAYELRKPGQIANVFRKLGFYR